MPTRWARETSRKQSEADWTPLNISFSNAVREPSHCLLDRYPNFPHVAVIRKKDERQKLQGATCKECEAVSVCFGEEKKKPPREKQVFLLPSVSITRTSLTKRSRRSCRPAPGTGSSTCLPARRRTSGRWASRPRRPASTEVGGSCCSSDQAAATDTQGSASSPSVLSRLHQGGLRAAASAQTAQEAAAQRLVLPQENSAGGAGESLSSIFTENRLLSDTKATSFHTDEWLWSIKVNTTQL